MPPVTALHTHTHIHTRNTLLWNTDINITLSLFSLYWLLLYHVQGGFLAFFRENVWCDVRNRIMKVKISFRYDVRWLKELYLIRRDVTLYNFLMKIHLFDKTGPILLTVRNNFVLIWQPRWSPCNPSLFLSTVKWCSGQVPSVQRRHRISWSVRRRDRFL